MCWLKTKVPLGEMVEVEDGQPGALESRGEETFFFLFEGYDGNEEPWRNCRRLLCAVCYLCAELASPPASTVLRVEHTQSADANGWRKVRNTR